MVFIGRKSELAFLNDAYTSERAEFIVLYGRRRVGKTELLNEFCKDKDAIFYTCREYTDALQLRAFTKKVKTHDIPALAFVDCFTSWEQAFSAALLLPTAKKKLLIIDEFPYACKANASIPSVLQVLWDEKLRHENVMIVLCGSAMSFMERDLLSEKNPLYGRTTGIYKLKPLPFSDAQKFFPSYSAEEKIISYAILGGIPHYLKQFDNRLSLADNVKRNILRRGCTLYNEVEFLIKQELREPAVYNTIIEAIAHGSNSFNDILTRTQIEKSKLSVYLKNLIELYIVEKEFPALAKEKAKISPSGGSYVLTDNFFRFWYSFAFGAMTDLENGDEDGVWENDIRTQLHHFAAKAFEQLSIEHVYTLNKARALPFRISGASRYWGKTNQTIEGKIRSVNLEIDVLATDATKEKVIYGECKFTNEPFGMTELRNLKSKVFFGEALYFYLFSLSGFTDALTKEAAADPNIRLISADDLITAT